MIGLTNKKLKETRNFLQKYLLDNDDLTSTKLLNGDCQKADMEKIVKILTKATKLSGGEQYARIQ